MIRKLVYLSAFEIAGHVIKVVLLLYTSLQCKCKDFTSTYFELVVVSSFSTDSVVS